MIDISRSIAKIQYKGRAGVRLEPTVSQDIYHKVSVELEVSTSPNAVSPEYHFPNRPYVDFLPGIIEDMAMDFSCGCHILTSLEDPLKLSKH